MERVTQTTDLILTGQLTTLNHELTFRGAALCRLLYWYSGYAINCASEVEIQ